MRTDTLRTRRAALRVGPIVLAAAVSAAVASPTDDLAALLLEALVGLAFLFAAGLARGPIRQRATVAAVGLAWIAGATPTLRGLHHALLALALVTFPSGRLRGAPAWALAATTTVAALGVLSQLGLAALFGGVATVSYLQLRREGLDLRYPVIAGGSVAIVFAVAGTVGQLWPYAYRIDLTLLVYEVVLVSIAAGFPLAVRRTEEARVRALHGPLLSTELEGLDAIASVLGDVLGDRHLHVQRPTRTGLAAAAIDGSARAGAKPPGGVLTVTDADRPVAVVTYRTRTLDDPVTRAAVTSAVRLAVENLDLRREQEAQLLALEAARARLVDAADRGRARTAVDLRDHVEAPLARASALLHDLEPSVGTSPAAPAISIARDELDGAAREIEALVAGVPPAGLGDGQLRGSLEHLVRRIPVDSSLAVATDVAGSVEAEESLFYVCSEALTNVVKHAGATHVRVEVRRVGRELVATISDDGCGGADPSGRGLQGLADRLAVRGGRLRVQGGPGAGTTVTASVPA